MSTETVVTEQPEKKEGTGFDDPAFAARIFLERYTALSKGERAVLRRADIVSTNEAFWRCLSGAAKIWPQIRNKTSIEILESLISSGVIDNTRSKNGALPFGTFLKSHEKTIRPRRVEAVLAATKREDVIEEISRVTSIARNDNLEFGLLFRDLYFFGDRVRRNWAQDCFAS